LTVETRLVPVIYLSEREKRPVVITLRAMEFVGCFLLSAKRSTNFLTCVLLNLFLCYSIFFASYPHWNRFMVCHIIHDVFVHIALCYVCIHMQTSSLALHVPFLSLSSNLFCQVFIQQERSSALLPQNKCTACTSTDDIDVEFSMILDVCSLLSDMLFDIISTCINLISILLLRHAQRILISSGLNMRSV